MGDLQWKVITVILTYPIAVLESIVSSTAVWGIFSMSEHNLRDKWNLLMDQGGEGSNCLFEVVGLLGSCVYWTVHHLDSWIKIDQLMSLALFFAQHVSNASTFIFRSLRLCVGILLWFDVCWCYGVVRLGWSGILMQASACIRIPTHIEPEQYTITESQAPEDECTSIRNMLSKK